MNLDNPPVRLLVALFSGLLIGIERERRRTEQGSSAFAGVRTFALISSLGGILAMLGEVYAVVGAIFIAIAVLAAYAKHRDEDRGLTSETALVLTYGLGVLSMHEPMIAAGSSVVITTILALRTPLHTFVRDTLTDQELHDAIIFAFIVIVILPLAPQTPLAGTGTLSLYTIIKLVIVLISITSAGYIAQRLWGVRYGLTITGFVGGFVSSTATIAAMGARSKKEPSLLNAAVAAGLASNIATILEYALLIFVVDPNFLLIMSIPLTSSLITAIVSTLIAAKNIKKIDGHANIKGHAFHLGTAIAFAVGIAAIAWLASLASNTVGRLGVVLVSAITSFVDAHATTGTIASMHHDQLLDQRTCMLAITTALSTNSITKIMLAISTGSRPYAIRMIPGIIAIAISAWVGIALTNL